MIFKIVLLVVQWFYYYSIIVICICDYIYRWIIIRILLRGCVENWSSVSGITLSLRQVIACTIIIHIVFFSFLPLNICLFHAFIILMVHQKLPSLLIGLKCRKFIFIYSSYLENGKSFKRNHLNGIPFLFPPLPFYVGCGLSVDILSAFFNFMLPAVKAVEI